MCVVMRGGNWFLGALLLAAACGDDGGAATTEVATTSGSGDTQSSLSQGADETSPVTLGTDGAEGGEDEGADSSGDAPDPGPGVDVQCGGQGGAEPGDGVICFYDVKAKDMGPAANIEYSMVEFEGQNAIYIRVIFAPWFADNTYGETAINWPDGHTFDELVGSDHANIVMSNAAGEVVLDFDLDYIEDDDDAPSGFRSQGVWEKNGDMNEGDEEAILAANSSLSRNLNERGYSEYLEDSPETDEAHTPNPATPDWDYRVVYEVWVDASYFGDEGDAVFAEACVQSIHASPSKTDENTLEVIPDECPPGWGCYEEDGCTECEESTDPDIGDDCDPTDGLPPIP